jgi:hypothetical protein
MNIRYNQILRRFEAEFSQDFQGDLLAVKSSGFKPDTSSGAWIWATQKAAVLNKIRKNKPASGLTITEEAYAAYLPLAETEEKNLEVKKLMKKAQKEAKQVSQEPASESGLIEEIWWEKESPPPEPFVSPYPPSPPAEYQCFVCKGPVYGSSLDLLEPWPICLWCEKQLDEQSKNNENKA